MNRTLIWAYRLGVLQVIGPDGRLSVETRDFDALRRALGNETLTGILRLFVWTDRISSLVHFAHWNNQNLPESSPAHGRNLQTVVWFASGVLFEAAEAIDQLERAGITSHLGGHLDHWRELRAMADRWTGRILRRGRNNLGFHVDPNVMAKGIQTLAASGEKLTILTSDEATITRATLRLGSEALFSGMGFTLQDFDTIISAAATDWGRFRELVELLVIQLFRHHGAWPPEPPGPPPER